MGGIDATSNQHLCPTNGCTSVGIENLALGGGGTTNGVGGIQNQYSQIGSYVKNVTFSNFSQTGLSIAAPLSGSYPGATYSGPYSNINFKAGGSGSPTCIDLEAQTQGVHGVTCTGNTNTNVINQGVGIIVNASNNTIEDVHIESFWDGIQVAPSPPQNPVANVLISNVTGTTTGNGTGGATKNTVHLCGPNTWNSSSFGTCGNSSTVEDITLLHLMNDNGSAGQTTVVDDSSHNGIVSCYTNGQPPAGPGCAAPLSTGIYALGEPYGASSGNPAYSIFTSSPTTPQGNYRGDPSSSSYMPTWGVGTNPTNSQYCSPAGAIYSQTNAGLNQPSVYVCKPVQIQGQQVFYGQWVPI
jgi:hypothetical protein